MAIPVSIIFPKLQKVSLSEQSASSKMNKNDNYKNSIFFIDFSFGFPATIEHKYEIRVHLLYPNLPCSVHGTVS